MDQHPLVGVGRVFAMSRRIIFTLTAIFSVPGHRRIVVLGGRAL